MVSARFFKTGEGEYAEGDKFLGVTVPQLRTASRDFRGLPEKDVLTLLKSDYHEERLLALLLMVDSFRTAGENERLHIYNQYLLHARYINNWDLVDSSAEYVVGGFLLDKPVEAKRILSRLALSSNLWERRISMLATFAFIKVGQFELPLLIARMHLGDKQDLMHKASGWMVREVGKRNIRTMEGFLEDHYKNMPRTMLRYAIEKLPAARRQMYLSGKV